MGRHDRIEPPRPRSFNRSNFSDGGCFFAIVLVVLLLFVLAAVVGAWYN